jgi:16S rRNA (uracil1498-N3)-methyltransferase
VTLALFLLDALPAGDVVVLDGEEGRHAATVRRIVAGESILVGDARGTVLTCQVRSVSSGRVEADVVSRSSVPLPEPRLVVVQALPKGDRAELAIELLTELGADEIVPWSASRSITLWQGERGAKALERWRRIAREATKQSRRAWAPDVAELASTADVGQRLGAAGTALVLHEDASIGIAEVPLTPSGDVVLVVGPEGGISPDELTRFEAAGAVAVHLGPAVLRTSTAGGAAAAALSLRLGRWS